MDTTDSVDSTDSVDCVRSMDSVDSTDSIDSLGARDELDGMGGFHAPPRHRTHAPLLPGTQLACAVFTILVVVECQRAYATLWDWVEPPHHRTTSIATQRHHAAAPSPRHHSTTAPHHSTTELGPSNHRTVFLGSAA